jgi:uncharacterized spore protein YtfJ
MDETNQGFMATSVKSSEQAADLIGRLFRVTEPGAVFSAPVTAGERTIIVASEVVVSMGVGFGSGGDTNDSNGGASVGGGGGGGGYSFGRPVATIIVEPQGVRVEPVVDPTKIAVAMFTTIGAMFFAWSSMRRSAGRR